MNADPNSANLPDARLDRNELLMRSMAFFGLLLIGFSWKLWTPQTEFPQVPVFSWLVSAPGWLDLILLAGMVVGLAGIGFKAAIGKVEKSHLAWIFIGSAAGSILLDQHRLQPWMYQLLILFLFHQTLDRRGFFNASRWLLASIYIFSAVSKFDYQFFHSMVDDFLNGMSLLGIPVAQDLGQERAVGIAMATGELLAGLFLLLPFQLVRGIGITLAALLHLSLLLLLSPFGLGNAPPVLVWNVAFLIQLLLLFSPLPKRWFVGIDQAGSKTTTGESGQQTLGYLILATVLIIPIAGQVGYADHWLSWELYAPRSSRAKIQVHSFKDAPVDLNRWSLTTLGVPVYPQSRFHVGCALAIEEAIRARESNARFSFRVESVSDRWTGERDRIAWGNTRASIENHASGAYWINTQPRKSFRLESLEEIPTGFELFASRETRPLIKSKSP